MRCPDCGNYLRFSFMDDLRKLPVYQCTSVGVAIEMKDRQGNLKVVAHTTDHQDHYFMLGRRVEPEQIGKQWTVHGKGLEDLAAIRRAEWRARDAKFLEMLEGARRAARLQIALRYLGLLGILPGRGQLDTEGA